MSSSNSGFGRDDLGALFGGNGNLLLSETLTRNPSQLQQQQSHRKNKRKAVADISNLSTAETAALLREQQQQQQPIRRKPKRHFQSSTRKGLPQYHQLLLEEQAKLQRQNHQDAMAENAQRDILHEQTPRRNRERDEDKSSSDGDDDDEEEHFVRKRQRVRTEPTILVEKEGEDRSSRRPQQRKDESYSSSSDSDSSTGVVPRRPGRRNDSDDDDDDHSSEDDRRGRILAKRRRQQAEIVSRRVDTNPVKLEKEQEISKELVKDEPNERKRFPRRGGNRDDDDDDDDSCSSEKESSSDDNSGDEDESSSTSSSDDESTSSEEAPTAVAKPLFVPRHARNTVKSFEEKEQELELQQKKLQEKRERRKLESRALVAQVVATKADTGQDNDNGMDESGGATNAPPNDEDPTDPKEQEEERDAWEMRELQRLLEHLDRREKEAEEQAEYERLKQMTDEERLAQDRALGLYKAPGENRRRNQQQQLPQDSNHLQRYFHRGAFFMDHEEWDQNDVRHKAKEYERAPTLDDKTDKRSLPKVMQVKKFGFAGNTKYKGLANEDTTDKKQDYLPVQMKRKKKKNKTQR